MSLPAPAEVIIGLDVGTTAVKAAAFAQGSTWRHVAMREYALQQPAAHEYVQDPDTILAAAAEALTECVAAVAPADVLAVSVSAGMHGLMALDDQRRPITALITWADARARDEARSLHQSGQATELHKITGVPVHPMTPLTKLMWFARHDPQVWQAARWWIGLKDLLLLWLTGAVITELSSASGSGMLDMATRTWSSSALDVCGVPPDRLPPIVTTTSTSPIAPATAEQVGLPAGTPIVAGAGDGPLGNLGTGALTPGVAGLSLGTSGAVRVVADGPCIDVGRMLFCYALTDTVWVLGGAISNGGAVIRWAGEALTPDLEAMAGQHGADEAVLDLAAKVAAGCDGLVLLPYLLPERAPLWDADLTGAFLGLHREHTRAHFVRAAVEGVCMQMRIIVDAVDEVEPVSVVHATGGCFRSSLWRDVMAAIIGRPLHVVDGADGTALGAAALGLFALGRAATLTDAAKQLGVGTTRQRPVTVDHASTATYDRLRASVPELIGQLGSVASVFSRG